MARLLTAKVSQARRKAFTLTTVYTEERLGRIMRLIEQYRVTKQRLRRERAFKTWRRADAIRRFASLLIVPPKRLH